MNSKKHEIPVDLVKVQEMIGKACSVDGSAEIFEKLKVEQARVTDYFESRQWVKDWKMSI